MQTACLTREGPKVDTIRRGQPGVSPWTADLDIDDFEGSVPRLVEAAGCPIWSPRYRDLNHADLALAQDLGIRVIPWSINRPTSIDVLLGSDVDGMISDYPDRVRTAMQARGMALPAPCSP
jgi:glycerophosphoryl diester phosphodiesterase